MKTKSKTSQSKSPAINEARLAVERADAGVREARKQARSAKSALKAARKAAKRADKAVKKARKEARRARKTVKTLLARRAKPKKRPVASRGSRIKKAAARAEPAADGPVVATSAEVLGEHR